MKSCTKLAYKLCRSGSSFTTTWCRLSSWLSDLCLSGIIWTKIFNKFKFLKITKNLKLLSISNTIRTPSQTNHIITQNINHFTSIKPKFIHLLKYIMKFHKNLLFSPRFSFLFSTYSRLDRFRYTEKRVDTQKKELERIKKKNFSPNTANLLTINLIPFKTLPIIYFNFFS